ncbi:hypothetical protein KQX54_002161 [Cotesia glomerata]|uniref:Uncharacterized protein n=1 Tax=Cotesia glomerata TaxID=32391 RepID=A0AAV7IIX4_COTGL|nr:hypothetical protein KQX54_002161 [Cotesia glomerata]
MDLTFRRIATDPPVNYSSLAGGERTEDRGRRVLPAPRTKVLNQENRNGLLFATSGAYSHFLLRVSFVSAVIASLWGVEAEASPEEKGGFSEAKGLGPCSKKRGQCTEGCDSNAPGEDWRVKG